jgi:hypothetical protein
VLLVGQQANSSKRLSRALTFFVSVFIVNQS